MHATLKPHPDTPRGPVTAIEVAVERLPGNVLMLNYRLTGAMQQVRIPAPAPLRRADELWRHTCFEAFVRVGDAYWELNFSPSGEWAAYRFDGYRTGMIAAMEVAHRRLQAREGELAVEVAGLPAGAWALGLSAVIEEVDGAKSYWALAHPPGRPDFHHQDCFALQLPPTE
jgi:hypothetical protein